MDYSPTSQFPINPTAIRYIKLGPKNRWFESCRTHNRIELGHSAVPHELAETGGREAVAAFHMAAGKNASKATDYAREISDFYHLDEHALWVTFAEGCLWWAFARQGVEMLGETEEHGSRADPSRSVVKQGRERAVLKYADLSTRLTKVSAYRRPCAA